jgi:hypothetical protein
MNPTPSKFIPSAVSDFVGHGDFGAATAARSIEALVAQSRANKNASMAILINGRPGIGIMPTAGLCRVEPDQPYHGSPLSVSTRHNPGVVLQAF